MAAPPSLITPAPTLATVVTHELLPRQTTDFGYGCIDYNKIIGCDNGMVDCVAKLGFEYNAQFTSAVTSCYCAFGLGYLDCYYSALTSSCAILSMSDYAYYQLEWFKSTCGSIPASAMARITPPSTVSISFTTVRSTRLSSRSTPPLRTGTPRVTGTGRLLGGGCSSTAYTLVDAGSTVYWAGWVGCISDKPECCPWTAAQTRATDAGPAAATTASSGGGGGGGVDTQNKMGFAFPSPTDGAQVVLANCAEDYYSISGACCPNGYFPFTSALGGQTPCWSSTNRMAAPTLTANVEGQPTDESKPTSAVVNIVWAVSFPVQSSGSSSSSLSAGAIAGIAVGGAAVVAILGLLWFFMYRRRRKGRAEGGAAAVKSNEKAGGGGPPAETMPNVPPQMGTPAPQAPLMHQQSGQFGATPPAPGMVMVPGQQQQQQHPPGQFIPQHQHQQQPFPGQQQMHMMQNGNSLAPYPYQQQQQQGVPLGAGGWGPPPDQQYNRGSISTATATPPPMSHLDGGARYSNSVVSSGGQPGGGGGGPGSEISSLSGAGAPLLPGVGGNSPGQVHIPHYAQQGGGSSMPGSPPPPPAMIAEADEGRLGYAVSSAQWQQGQQGYMGEEMYAPPPPAGAQMMHQQQYEMAGTPPPGGWQQGQQQQQGFYPPQG